MSERVIDTKLAFAATGLPELLTDWWSDLDEAVKGGDGSVGEALDFFLDELLHHEAECALIYSHDIVQAWNELGRPEEHADPYGEGSLLDMIAVEAHMALVERWREDARAFVEALPGFTEAIALQGGEW